MKDEDELEEAREAMHGQRSPQTVALFKERSKRVARRRQRERQEREAAGPPSDAERVVRDGAGLLLGFNTPQGDAVVTPGSTA